MSTNKTYTAGAGLSLTLSTERLRRLPQTVKEALHRQSVWGFLVSMAVILVVSVAFFYPDNFDGKTLMQSDSIQGMANGEEARAYEEATGEKALWTNSLFGGMPTFQIAPKYPSNGLFTWINSVYGLGLPVPSNLMFMMMFGMLIMLSCLKLRWWYALIGSLAWGLSTYFVIIIGAGHIWKFVALSYVPPTIAGLIMIYHGRRTAGAAILALFMMLELNANHPQITYYFTFLMVFLAIAFLIVAIQRKTVRNWLVGSVFAVVAGALAIGANLPSLYITYEYSKETKRASSELTPLPGQGEQDNEKPTGGLPKSEIGGWSNAPEESLSLLIPNIKGGASIKPEKGTNRPLLLSENEHFESGMLESEPEITDGNGNYGTYPIYSQLTEYFGGKGFTNGPIYVGIIIFALFVLGCFIVPGPVKWTLLVATIFSVMLAMGNHFSTLTDFMIYNVPLYNKFRAAETAMVIACLCMPLLGMLALQRLFTMPDPLRNTNVKLGLSVALGFPLFICLALWICPSLTGSALSETDVNMLENIPNQITAAGYIYNPDQINAAIDTTVKNIETIRYGLVSSDALRSAMLLLVGAATLYFALRRRISYGVACLILGAVITIDLYSVDKRYVDHDSFAPAMKAGKAIKPDEIDQAIMQDKGYYRVADYTAFGDARRSYFHKMVGGYHAAKLNRYNDLIERGKIGNPAVLNMLNTKYIIGTIQDPGTGRQYLNYEQNPQAWGPAWLASDIEYVDNADAEFAALDSLTEPQSVVADAKFCDVLGQPAALSPGDNIVLDKYTPNSLTYTVDTHNGGVAVFSEVWFPWGWTATVDGEEVPIGRVNYVLRSIRVPAGHHTVVMTFDPPSLHTTGAIAYTSIILIYLLAAGVLLLPLLRTPRKDDEKANV